MKQKDEEQLEIYHEVSKKLDTVKLTDPKDINSYLFLGAAKGGIVVNMTGSEKSLMTILVEACGTDENLKEIILKTANEITRRELPGMLTDILNKLTNSTSKKDTCQCDACKLRRSLQRNTTKPDTTVN